MATNTDFIFNGLSLGSDQRWKLKYIPDGIPKKRGDNVHVPFISGTRWIPKQYEERYDVLNLWLLPVNASGGLDEEAGGDPRAQLEINAEYLKSKFGVRQLVPVRKLLRDGTYRTTKAEVVNSIDFEKDDEASTHRVFSVELTYPDPFWYAELPIIETMEPLVTGDEFTFVNSGTSKAVETIIKMTGPLSAPKIYNRTNDVWVQFQGAVAEGTTITISSKDFTCYLDDTNMLSGLKHGGALNWLVLEPGSNVLAVTSSVMGGSIEISYLPVYF